MRRWATALRSAPSSPGMERAELLQVGAQSPPRRSVRRRLTGLGGSVSASGTPIAERAGRVTLWIWRARDADTARGRQLFSGQRMRSIVVSFCSRITLPQRCVSDLMYLSNVSGSVVINSNICGARNFSRNAASLRIFCTSALIFITTSRGMALGRPARTRSPPRSQAARFPRPSACRAAAARASARRRRGFLASFSWCGCTTRLTLIDIRSMCPAMTSLSAGAAPR